MTNKEVKKIVDELIVRLPIGKGFPLQYELSVYFISVFSKIDLNTDKTCIVEDVMDFMIEHEYIRNRPNKINDKLTEKGIEAKKAGGHFKYLGSLKPKKEYWLSKYQVISISLVVIFGLFGVYKYFDNKELKSQYSALKSQQSVLNSDFDALKLKYDSVLKQRIESPKQNLNDSLQTKNTFE